MPTVEIVTDPDSRNGGDPMKERLIVNYTPSPRSSPPSSPPSTRSTPTSKLARVNEEILFEPEDAIKVSGRIHIKNVSVPSSTLVFKIKTTDPDKFHVWPTIGLIADRGSAVSKVTLKPTIKPGSILNDKFQVEIMVVPRTLLGQIQSIEEDDQQQEMSFESAAFRGRNRRSSLAGEPGHSVSTLSELNASWREIASTGAQAETHKITITVDPSLLNEPDTPIEPQLTPTPTGNDAECAQKLQQLEFRLDNLDNDIMEQFTYVQILMYILLGILVAAIGIHLFLSGGGNIWEHAQGLANIPNTLSTSMLKDNAVLNTILNAKQILNVDKVMSSPLMTSAPSIVQQQMPMPSLPPPPPLPCLDKSRLRREACPLFG